MRLWWLAAISCLIASGADKEFEVVSIRVAPERDPDYYKQLPSQRNDPKPHIDAGLVSLPYEGIGMLLHRAFDLPIPQVITPAWVKTEQIHYAILARVPEGATEKDVPEMLRNMLAQRFGMTYHRETRPTEALTLTVARSGLKAKPSDQAPWSRGDTGATRTGAPSTSRSPPLLAA